MLVVRAMLHGRFEISIKAVMGNYIEGRVLGVRINKLPAALPDLTVPLFGATLKQEFLKAREL